MQLDLRLPMGFMFTIFGLLLAGFGLASDRTIYERSLGINVNLWWGLALLVFGLVSLGLALSAAKTRHGSVRSHS